MNDLITEMYLYLDDMKMTLLKFIERDEDLIKWSIFHLVLYQTSVKHVNNHSFVFIA